jgi:hypothetical protein
MKKRGWLALSIGKLLTQRLQYASPLFNKYTEAVFNSMEVEIIL